MCTVSNIGDYAGMTIPNQYPFIPHPLPNLHIDSKAGTWPAIEMVPKDAFDKLKKEVEALKILLAAAAAYDKATNQPHCEHPDKVKFLKELAKFVDVDLGDILG